MGDLTRNFSKWEFQCPCCGLYNMDLRLVDILQHMRTFYGRRIDVSSGSRCEKHNAAVGGKPNSEHLVGRGVDIVCLDSNTRYLFIKLAMCYNVKRIGVGRDFIHLGVDDSLPVEVMWLY